MPFTNFKYYFKWILFSVLIGVITAIGKGLIYSRLDLRGENYASIILFVECFVIQLSNAAVMEEPLFRGFMWGCLEKSGWRQAWILLFQATIFCIGHVYYLPHDPIFFIGTFIDALVFGFLVWKSKSIGTSMIAHGLINSLVDLIVHYKWN